MQALRAFGVKKYREAIDFFLLPPAQRQKKSVISLRPLRLCVKIKNRSNDINLHIFSKTLFDFFKGLVNFQEMECFNLMIIVHGVSTRVHPEIGEFDRDQGVRIIFPQAYS